MKHLISQNIDGLHLRSGVSREKISELHGNTYLETCADCGKGYMRDHRTRNDENDAFTHLTGRDCDECGGALNDSIINFGEKLPQAALESAQHHTIEADFCLSLGSSLQVKPAMLFPMRLTSKRGCGLAIVNLQPTPLDHLAKVRIWGHIDEVMEELVEEMKNIE